jgi:hypothetical protein
MYYSGIDLHSDNCYITTLDDTGAVVKRQRIKNDNERVLEYFHSLPVGLILISKYSTSVSLLKAKIKNLPSLLSLVNYSCLSIRSGNLILSTSLIINLHLRLLQLDALYRYTANCSLKYFFYSS